MPEPKRLGIEPGALSTTGAPFRVPEGHLQEAYNVRRDNGKFELSDRYRIWGTSLSEPGGVSINGAGIGSFRHSSECEKIFIIRTNGADQDFHKADVSGSTSAAAANWGSAIDTLTATQGWVGWQHLDRFYWAGSATNQVQYIATPCGSSTLDPEYKINGWATDQVDTSIADYAVIPFTIWGTDAGALPGAGNFVRYTDAQEFVGAQTDNADDLDIITNALRIYMDGNAAPPAAASNSVAYIYQTAQDWAGTSAVAVKLVSNGYANGLDLTVCNIDNFKFYIQKSGSGTWHEARRGDYYEASTTELWIWYDLSDVDAAALADLKKIRFSTERIAGGAGYIGDLEIYAWKGGQTYSLQDSASDTFDRATYPERNVRYYVRYRSADGNHVSSAIQAQVSAITHNGLSVNANLPKMGSLISLAVQTAAAPWTTSDFIDIYRLVEDVDAGTSRIYRIVTGASNAATYNWTDELSDRDILNGTYTSFNASDFVVTGDYEGGATAITDISCGTSWKGSNVLADIYGKVFFARVGTYNQWIWPGVDADVDAADVGRARTVQVTGTRMPILAMVAQDALYMFSNESVYAMAGEYPSESVGPALVPHAYGAVSGKGCVAYYGGSLYGTMHGLYAIQVPMNFGGTAEPVVYEELTERVRPSWESLLGSNPEKLVVAADDKEIWCFVNERWMHRDADGNWATGEWADDMFVFNAWGHRKYGVVGVTSAGRAFVLGAFPTDGGTTAAGDNGTAASWRVKTRRLFGNLRVLRSSVVSSERHDETDIAVTCNSEFGGTHTIDYEGGLHKIDRSFSGWGKPPSGKWMEFELSGTGEHSDVLVASVSVVDYDERREE